MMETSPLIETPIGESRKTGVKNLYNTAAAVFVLILVIGVLQVVSPSRGIESLQSHFDEEINPMLNFRVSNEYYDDSRQHPGKGYSFIKYGTLVEPHRITTLTASLAKDEKPVSISEASWRIEQRTNIKDDGAQIENLDGEKTTVLFKNLGKHLVHLKAKTPENSFYEYEEMLTVIYVRRELRSLSDTDLDEFLSAVKLTTELDGVTGRAMFGGGYYPMDHFVSVHLMNAADRLVDHMHDGMGFITQHVALTSEFETTIQSIKPCLTVPYWDYTIDSMLVAVGNITSVWESKVWHPDFFGAPAAGAKTVEEGRWAYMQIGRNTSNSVHNAYGYLRAPWNVNKSPYLTRIRSLCGVETLSSWPSCATHFDVTFSDYYSTWYNYVWSAGYAPHGPIHVLIGGYGYCETELDEVALKYGLTNHERDTLKSAVITYVKSAWRMKLVESPVCSDDVHQKKCVLKCRGDVKTDTHFMAEAKDFLLSRTNATWLDRLSYNDQAEAVNTILCEIPYVSGDQLEAGSPVDPSFWPIHPTMDRLLQYKHMVNEFVDQGWANPDGATKFCSSDTTCRGHNAFDITPFKSMVMDTEGNYREMELTNAELYKLAHPAHYSLAYVYEHFEWKHCEKVGVVFEPVA